MYPFPQNYFSILQEICCNSIIQATLHFESRKSQEEVLECIRISWGVVYKLVARRVSQHVLSVSMYLEDSSYTMDITSRNLTSDNALHIWFGILFLNLSTRLWSSRRIYRRSPIFSKIKEISSKLGWYPSPSHCCVNACYDLLLQTYFPKDWKLGIVKTIIKAPNKEQAL